ncbi:MAG: hypothetical protein U9R53_09875 [Chloroflexota bacterium]|nr:hypothetical protein [Chloroflexota bacterium]
MMSVIDQIASAQGRRDDVPNKELAKALAEEENKEGIQEIANNLQNAEPKVISDCIKVLYEVGYINPSLIAEYWQAFLDLLDSKHNRLVWGGMTALSTIAMLKANELFPYINEIKKAVTNGSVITRDGGITALAGIGSMCEEYRNAIFPFLFDILLTCRPKDVPSYSEKSLVTIDDQNADQFIQVLEERLPSLSERQAKRVTKVKRKVERIGKLDI